MLSIAAIISILMLAIITGKHTRHIGLAAYVFTTTLALMLVCIILYDMLTMQRPTP